MRKPKSLIHFAALLALGVALSGCETTGEPAPQAAAAPVTHEQAALDCWMATEKDAARLGLDKRADLVDKCIAGKMSGKESSKDLAAAPQPPANPAPGAKPAALPAANTKPKS